VSKELTMTSDSRADLRPEWLDAFPEPRTFPSGWDLTGVLAARCAPQTLAARCAPTRRLTARQLGFGVVLYRLHQPALAADGE
jgi:hypothetical protein